MTGVGRFSPVLLILTLFVAAGAEVSASKQPSYRIVFTEVGPGQGVDEGGRIVLLSPDGSTRVLTPQFAAAADPSVSFDGKRIVFAAKTTPRGHWNVYDMQADGSGVRQITRDRGNCRKPSYQSAIFYLNDATPSYQVTFQTDAAGEFDERTGQIATHLYSVRPDGSGTRRLTYPLASSVGPFQMQDGRILFSGWLGRRLDLFAIHLDGTDYAAFSGSQGKRFKRMACVTPQGLAAFVESDRDEPDGSGNVATLSLRRNLRSYRPVTQPSAGLFHSPSPLPDGSVLVSRRSPATAGRYAIYRLDLETGGLTLIHGDAATNAIQAVALAPRQMPDGHSSVVEDDQNWSKLYCLNVYERDLKTNWKPGQARRVRLIEGVPGAVRGAGFKRLLGYVQLEDDGSFQALVPPNTPIQIQVLDANDVALRTSAWIWTKNKENRGCIGCHEDGERTPENVFAKALGRPAPDLMLPRARRRTVSFERDMKPTFRAKCSGAGCHPNGAVEASRRGRISAAVLGRSGVKRMPPAAAPALTGDERRAILEWIDMGGQP